MSNQDASYDVKIALLNQKVEMLEQHISLIDTDIKQLRSDVQKGFDKLIERFDLLKDDMAKTKSFGKGVYWVVGVVVGALIIFKDNLIGLFI